VAKPELGAKRQCKNCGAKFFDLNKLPIICPMCSADLAVQVAPVFQRASTADGGNIKTGAAELVSKLDAGDDNMIPMAADARDKEEDERTFWDDDELPDRAPPM
jgi:uncharacterized protein (TIGR02300 family)